MSIAESVLLKAEGVSKSFGSGHAAVRAVNDVSLEVEAGELVLIMGPSGSGKTTLLSMLGGLLRPDEGRIVVDGTDIGAADESSLPDIRARKLGFVFQSFNLLEALSVRENILFPAQLVPGSGERANQRADELIGRLGLQARRHALPATLSGGEKQRVAIARALINQPPLVLADEPTGNLDSQSGQEVMMVLHDLVRDERRSVLFVTHDPRVEDVADRVLWLADGTLHDRKESIHDWVRCPVCNMRVDRLVAKYSTTYKEKSYTFCTHRCFERFQLAPDQYVK